MRRAKMTRGSSPCKGVEGRSLWPARDSMKGPRNSPRTVAGSRTRRVSRADRGSMSSRFPVLDRKFKSPTIAASTRCGGARAANSTTAAAAGCWLFRSPPHPASRCHRRKSSGQRPITRPARDRRAECRASPRRITTSHRMERFLMVRDDDTATASTRVVVVMTWAEELKARVATATRQ